MLGHFASDVSVLFEIAVVENVGRKNQPKTYLIYPDMAQLFTDSIELDYLKYKFPHLSNHYSATPFIPSIPFQHIFVGISPYALFHFHHFKLGHKHECICHFGEELVCTYFEEPACWNSNFEEILKKFNWF